MKKGYMLIELIVIMLISTMVVLAIFTLLMLCRNVYKSRELEKCKLQVISFIYYSQHYCKSNGKTAYINFDKDKEKFKMILKCENKKVREVNISCNIDKVQYTINKKKENYIEISNLGMINNEGEIEIEYIKNKQVHVLIGAGGVYCEW